MKYIYELCCILAEREREREKEREREREMYGWLYGVGRVVKKNHLDSMTGIMLPHD